MNRWIAPILLSLALAPGAVMARPEAVDDVLLACTADPAGCTETVLDFIEGLDTGSEESQVTLGILAERLFNMGIEMSPEQRRNILGALQSLSDTLETSASADSGQLDAVNSLIADFQGAVPGDNADGEPVEASSQ